MKGASFEKGFEKNFSRKEAAEIAQLKGRIKKLEAQLERQESREEKEKIIKKEIKSYLQELQKTPRFAPPTVSRDELKEIKQFSPDQQVGALIALVFEKGLNYGLSIAQALDNPAVLDEFHDVLVDRYYQMLVEKKILKKV